MGHYDANATWRVYFVHIYSATHYIFTLTMFTPIVLCSHTNKAVPWPDNILRQQFRTRTVIACHTPCPGRIFGQRDNQCLFLTVPEESDFLKQLMTIQSDAARYCRDHFFMIVRQQYLSNHPEKMIQVLMKRDLSFYFGLNYTVRIQGLQRRPDLNGITGKVEGYKYDPSTPELFRLVLKTEESVKLLLLRPCNVSLISPLAINYFEDEDEDEDGVDNPCEIHPPLFKVTDYVSGSSRYLKVYTNIAFGAFKDQQQPTFYTRNVNEKDHEEKRISTEELQVMLETERPRFTLEAHLIFTVHFDKNCHKLSLFSVRAVLSSATALLDTSLRMFAFIHNDSDSDSDSDSSNQIQTT